MALLRALQHTRNITFTEHVQIGSNFFSGKVEIKLVFCCFACESKGRNTARLKTGGV